MMKKYIIAALLFFTTTVHAQLYYGPFKADGSNLPPGAVTQNYTRVVAISKTLTLTKGISAATGNFTSSVTVKPLILSGSSSGTLTLTVPATAGTNTITLPAGTTNFSSTGGTSQVVKQTTSGGAFTVAQLAASDLSNGTTGSGSVVLATSPTLETPVLGTPQSGVLTNCTGTASGLTAGAATVLATGRTIGGVNFDGSANIVPQTIEAANEATDTTCFPLFITASGTQQLQPKNNTGLTYNSTTNALAATTFSGALSGNSTTATALQTARTIGGVSFDGTAAIVPQTIQSINEATDTTCYPLFITASGSQSLQPNNNAGLVYNSNTNNLTSTTFTGALAGNATTATTLATTRAIYGNNFDGSAALDQIIASTYGGTGNGFSKFSGATTSEKTYTLPNSNAKILTDAAAVTVAQGGTGATSLTGILLGNGTSPVTVITNSSSNWDTAYTDRLKWDGGATDLTASTGRTSLGLVIGTDVQAYNANLAALAGLTSSADKLPYFTGSGTASVANFTANGRYLVSQSSSANIKSSLSLNNVENTALSTWAGSSNLVTVGTLTTLATTDNNSMFGTAGSAQQYISIKGTSTGTNLAATAGDSSGLNFYNLSNTDNNFSSVGFYNSNSLIDAKIVGVHHSQASRHGEVAFLTHNGVGLAEAVRIDKDQQVGIGTTTPVSRLQVNGTITATALSLSSGAVVAGTYTPTLTSVANLDATTAYQCQYIRVGNVITVSGKVAIDPTLAATSTQLGISFPVASNISAQENVGGTAFASGIAAQGAAILGDSTNDRAQLQFISGDVTNHPMYFSFTYLVQ